MVRISWQLTMMLLTLIVAGCATERPRLHVGSHSQQCQTAPPLPQNNYSPEYSPEYAPEPPILPDRPELDGIPAPPSGASFEKADQDHLSKLRTAERPPLLLRPIAWTFGSSEPLVKLKAPQPMAAAMQSDFSR